MIQTIDKLKEEATRQRNSILNMEIKEALERIHFKLVEILIHTPNAKSITFFESDKWTYYVDDWVESAFNDDVFYVELAMRLKAQGYQLKQDVQISRKWLFFKKKTRTITISWN
jgi:hypothetical protein